jgi:preprotein translocase subunit SecY
MENIDPALLQQFLQNNSGETSPTINLFPESFINLLTAGFIALNVIAALFLIVYIIGMVRKWKVQSAVLDMHKDVKELKQLMTREKPQNVIDKDTSKTA